MLFNSLEFIFIFLPVVLMGCKLIAIRSTRAAIWWLALASLVFYGAWSIKILPVLIVSVLFNYASAVFISKLKNRARAQHWCLIGAVSINLAVLCYFKYLFPTLNFFADLGVLPGPFQNVILPLGISFFTFTQIAYLIDLKQGEAELEPLGNYLFFATFFPHLIAGPILHHHEIMPQLSKRETLKLNSTDMASGLTLFVIGLFKKLIFADKIGAYVPALFNQPNDAGLVSAWCGCSFIRHAALFRLLRLFRHGRRPCLDVLHSISPQLQFSLPSEEHHRLLATLAYDADALSHALFI